MTETPASTPPPAGTKTAPSPWWQTALFVVAAAVLVLRKPDLALALAFLGVVIFVHELGHFAVARWQGMRVETFSLGFGPPLIKIERGGTVYQIAAVPLGGFVKPAGENPETDEQIAAAKPDEFMGKPWWSRGLVLLAGPAMNLIFPVLALFLVYATVGRSYPWGPPQVSAVVKDSGAGQAGMQPGDLIIKVNGQQVNNTRLLATLVDKLSRQDLDKPLNVDVLRGQAPVQLKVSTRLNKDMGKFLMGVQVQPSAPPFSTRVRLAGVLTPAEKAGFKKGDVVLSVDGTPLKDGFSFNAVFAKAKSDPVPIAVSRGAELLILSAAKKQPVPEGIDPELLGLLGLEFEPAGPQGKAMQRDQLPLLKAAQAAALDTATAAFGIFLGLKELFSGHMSVRESLGGPVAILRMAAQQAERGWEDLLQLMLNISLTLGIMNLLPIPILDGGTFVFCVIEGIRGKPLRLRTQVLMQNVGLTLLLTLFAFTMVNDLLRWAGH